MGWAKAGEAPLIELMIKLILFPDYCHPFLANIEPIT